MLEARSLFRSVNADYLDADEIARLVTDTEECESELVLVDGEAVPFNLDIADMNFTSKSVKAALEADLAKRLHQALVPARAASPALLMDTGIWTWIALGPLQDYVVERWCGGRTRGRGLEKPEGCSYFLTGHSLADQTRCAPRRLWIAANTSWLAEGDYSHVENLLKFTDLYTGIFERMLGMDAELAVEMATQLKDLPEHDRRTALKLIGALLSTTALEFLDRGEKSQLIAEVIEDLAVDLI